MRTQPFSVPAELASLLEGLPEPHILIDEQYRILAANTAYRRQFGPQEEVVNRKCYAVSHHFTQPCDQAGKPARAPKHCCQGRCSVSCTCTIPRRARSMCKLN